MAAKKGKSTSLSVTDYTKFPGPFSLNTKASKNNKVTKSKSAPKAKQDKTNPAY